MQTMRVLRSRASTTFMSSESESIQQLLLNVDGRRLFVALERSLKLYSTEEGCLLSTVPLHHHVHWIISPADPKVLLGFGPESLLTTHWDDQLNIRHFPIETAPPHDSDGSTPTINFKRRPSASYPMSPTEVETSVGKVLQSRTNDLVLIELSHATFQGRRDTDRIIVDISSMTLAGKPAKLVVKPLPSELVRCIEIPIGFVASPTEPAEPYDRNVSVPQSPTKASLARHPALKDNLIANGNVLVFLSKDYWICTYDLNHLRDGASSFAAEETKVKRFFFLPRDWVNTDLLQLATITADGHILCPRNGEVAVIENGLVEPWVD